MALLVLAYFWFFCCCFFFQLYLAFFWMLGSKWGCCFIWNVFFSLVELNLKKATENVCRHYSGNRILTSFLSLAYLTTVGSSVILIPSPLDTDAICWQNLLSWPSLHQREGAKQANAQVSMRAPLWSDLLRMSHAPSCGTKGRSWGPSLSLGAGRTRPSNLTMSVLTEVLNSSFKYLLLAFISWA